MWRRWLYCTTQAFASVRQSFALSLLAAGTIAAVLLILAVYLLAWQNLERLALVWGRTASMVVYLADDLPAADQEALRLRLAQRAGVEQATLVAAAEALARFRQRGPEAAALVEGVNEDVLPASVELRLGGGFVDVPAVAALAEEIKGLAGVESVDFGREEFAKLQAFLGALRYGAIAIGMVIALAAAFIVANTVRLLVYARREEIVILRLVGATPWFVRAPFLLEGIFWGAGGAVLALTILAVTDWLFAAPLGRAVRGVLHGLEVRLWAPEVAVWLVGLGAVLGLLGSALAVHRFLDADAEAA